MNDFFKILNYISYEKKPYTSLTESEKKSINIYMLNRYLSMEPKYLEIVNEVQSLKNLESKDIYNIYLRILPKEKKFFKYIKSSNSQEYSKFKILSTYLECSERECKEFHFIPPNDIDDILNLYGYQEDSSPNRKNKKSRSKKN